MARYPSLSHKRHVVGLLHLVIVFTLFHETHSQNATVEDFTRLIKDKISPFDNSLRPLINQSEALDVYVTIHLLSLLEIREKQQQIQLNAWLNFSWYDEIRPWNTSDYGGLYLIHPKPLDIWIPRVIISNSLGKRDLFEDDYAPTTIFSNGASRWYPGTVFSLSCDLDLTYFPFDTQRCSMMIIGKYLRNSVILQFSSARLIAGGYTSNGEWEFVSHDEATEPFTSGNEDFNRLVIFFMFERRPMFYVINILVPVMFMSFLSFFGFIIPHDSGERHSFAITVLLSLAVYMTIVSSEIPPTSDTFPIIVHYIFSLLLLSGFSVVVIVVLHRIQRETSEAAVPAGENHFEGCKKCTKTNSVAPLEHNSYEGVFGMDSNNVVVDGGVTPSDGTIPRVMTQPANVNTDKEEDARSIHSRSMPTAKPDKLNSAFYKAKRGSAVKTIFRFLKQGDIQLFLLFALVWIVLSVHFLDKLLSNN